MTFFDRAVCAACFLSATSLAPIAASALTVTSIDDADVLADSLFLNIPGLTVTDATLFGSVGQAGTYTNVIGTYGLPQNGIIFSTGNVSDYGAGGNIDSGNTTGFGIPASENQEALLDPITGGPFSHFDTVQLNIEFEAAADVSEVTFFGAFGSEEYPEYVGSSFVDGFGLYVNGFNVAGISEFNGSTPLPVNIDHPSFAPITGTELDGMLAPGDNPVLRFDVPVEAGETNNFTLILADTSDAILDTTVYLSSFIASNPGGGGGTPSGSGATEFDPLLPVVNENGEVVFDENGGFIIDIDGELASSGQTIWVDPPVSVGFTYEVDGGALITSITAPSLATVADISGYTLTFDGITVDIAAGQTLQVSDIFNVDGISSLTLGGIDESLMLDPANPVAFPLGLSFDNVFSNFSVTVTPITVDVGGPGMGAVPLPAGSLLYIGGLALIGGVLRRRKAAA